MNMCELRRYCVHATDRTPYQRQIRLDSIGWLHYPSWVWLYFCSSNNRKKVKWTLQDLSQAVSWRLVARGHFRFDGILHRIWLYFSANYYATSYYRQQVRAYCWWSSKPSSRYPMVGCHFPWSLHRLRHYSPCLLALEDFLRHQSLPSHRPSQHWPFRSITILCVSGEGCWSGKFDTQRARGCSWAVPS